MIKEYFSHDYLTREDDKIADLFMELGVSGYGAFWCIVEELYKNANALQMDCKRIAYKLRTDSDLISKVINDFGLFQIKDNIISSESVQRRIDERNSKSIKARESANKRWENANALQPQSAPIANKVKVKEKLKEKKDIIGETIVSPDYKKFYDWLGVDAPRLLKMKEPFTETQYLKILSEFSKEEIYDTVLAMQNYEGLTKKVSANLTFRKWATNNRERNNKNIPTDNPNQLYQNGYPVDKNNPMTFI